MRGGFPDQFQQHLLAPAVELLADLPQRQPQGLVVAHGQQLQPVLLREGLDVTAEGGVQQTDGPVVADGPLGEVLGRLPVGGLDPMFFAPSLHRAGKLFERIGLTHGSRITSDSVTVNRYFRMFFQARRHSNLPAQKSSAVSRCSLSVPIKVGVRSIVCTVRSGTPIGSATWL